MQFLNNQPREPHNLPDWFDDLKHEESKLYMIALYDSFYIREMKSVAQYNRYQLYIKLGKMETTDDNYLRVYHHAQNIEEHIQHIINLESEVESYMAKLYNNLGDDFLKTQTKLYKVK